MFSEFFNPEKIERSKHTVVLKDWPLKPFLNCPFEGGQTSHKQMHKQIHKRTLWFLW